MGLLRVRLAAACSGSRRHFAWSRQCCCCCGQTTAAGVGHRETGSTSAMFVFYPSLLLSLAVGSGGIALPSPKFRLSEIFLFVEKFSSKKNTNFGAGSPPYNCLVRKLFSTDAKFGTELGKFRGKIEILSTYKSYVGNLQLSVGKLRHLP